MASPRCAVLLGERTVQRQRNHRSRPQQIQRLDKTEGHGQPIDRTGNRGRVVQWPSTRRGRRDQDPAKTLLSNHSPGDPHRHDTPRVPEIPSLAPVVRMLCAGTRYMAMLGPCEGRMTAGGINSVRSSSVRSCGWHGRWRHRALVPADASMCTHGRGAVLSAMCRVLHVEQGKVGMDLRADGSMGGHLKNAHRQLSSQPTEVTRPSH